ncbi:MAG: hypothetical protein J0G32_07180 [Alphaproteobacteria bacterium]|nr:hypothetical protein [Alphaproteobacteria bacterium]OJV13597.1 MAG: hypothetical protein BGO27_03170 [Alphaproteobacteria bacterium 33-17]
MSKNRTNITKQQFISAIKEFKRSKNLSLKSILTDYDLTRELLSVPEIGLYLSRSDDAVEFLEYRPELIKFTENMNKDMKNHTDYHELTIYKSEQAWMYFPYRDEIETDDYYKKGTMNNSLNTVFNIISEEANNYGIEISNPKYIVDISRKLHSFNIPFESARKKHNVLKDGNIKFVISPNWENGHAVTLISILDSDSKKILLTILINTNIQTLSYNQSICDKLNKRGVNTYPIYANKENLSALEQKFHLTNIANAEPQIISNENNTEILKITDKFEICPTEFKEKQLFAQYKLGAGSIDLFVNNDIKILDASHALQDMSEASEDQNCAIYGINFIKAIVEILKTPEQAILIKKLASEIHDNNNSDAITEIQNIFQNDLKQYLPMYYDADGKARPYEEIRKHHLKQRWNIGSESFAVEFRDSISPKDVEWTKKVKESSPTAISNASNTETAYNKPNSSSKDISVKK